MCAFVCFHVLKSNSSIIQLRFCSAAHIRKISRITEFCPEILKFTCHTSHVKFYATHTVDKYAPVDD